MAVQPIISVARRERCFLGTAPGSSLPCDMIPTNRRISLESWLQSCGEPMGGEPVVAPINARRRLKEPGPAEGPVWPGGPGGPWGPGCPGGPGPAGPGPAGPGLGAPRGAGLSGARGSHGSRGGRLRRVWWRGPGRGHGRRLASAGEPARELLLKAELRK